MKNRLFQILVPIALLVVSVYAAKRPYYNWDMFPYMALAARQDSVPFATTHSQVYREAEKQMVPTDFKAISQRQPLLMNSPSAFESILKYFEIKPGYIQVVRFGTWLGLDLLSATHLPSAICYFLIGSILFMWMQRYLPVAFAALMTLLTAALPFLIQTARYSSPDMLCAFLLMAGLFLAMEYSAGAGLMLSGLSILVRPDAVIFYVPVILALIIMGKATLLTGLIAMTIAVMLAFVVIGDTHVLEEFLFTDADYSSTWNRSDKTRHYFQSLKNGFQSITGSFSVFSFLAILVIFSRTKRDMGYKDRWTILLYMAVGSMVIRYLLHPVVEDRFLIFPYLITIMGVCDTIPKYLFPFPKRTLT